MCVSRLTRDSFVSSGYDVQSASTPDGVLYITGAPRYNHTGRVVVYRLKEKNEIVVTQILKGEQVSLLNFRNWQMRVLLCFLCLEVTKQAER